MAYEKVSLFGLTVVPRRRVRYAGIDPVESRRLLVEHGLMEGDFDSRAEFFKHNRKLLEDIAARATKTRRRELIVEPHVLYRFYDERVPATVVDGPSLDRWLKTAPPGERQRLFLTEADALGGETPVPAKDAFPDQLQIDKLKLPLAYRFEPGDERDGLTVTVPSAAVSQLTEERLGWLIPGLVEEKIQALIKTLPKSVRREFGPAPEIARKLAAEIDFAAAPFLSTVAAALSRVSGTRISPEMFDLARLPPHLRINIRVVDQTGLPVAEGRDLATIRSQLGEAPAAAAVPADSKWHREGITKWDFGALLSSVDVRIGGLTLTKYPAIVDAGESAALRLVDSTKEAERLTRLGVLRLFEISERRELKTQVRWLPSLAQMTLFAAPLCKERALEEQLVDLLAARAFYSTNNEIPRDADDFEARRLIGRRHIVPAAQEVGKLAPQIFEAYHEVRLALDTSRPAAWRYAIDDMRRQLEQLTPPNFLIATSWTWLQHFPRYLKGITQRLGRLQSGGLPRDQEAYKQLAPRWQALHERLQSGLVQPKDAEPLDSLRWMLEELRISLFAQSLGTSMAVSPQRFDKQWSQLQG
jgi:ATP-dependent helicase HrpA